MGKIQIPQKIRDEDFSSEEVGIASKIGAIYNNFADEVYRVLNKGIDNDNLNRQRSILTVQIGTTGQLMTQYQIKSILNGKIAGINVLSAINLDNPNTYPVSAPFVSFTNNGSIVTILNISGLQNSSTYNLTLELVV